MSNDQSPSCLARVLRFLLFSGIVLVTIIVLVYAGLSFWGRREWAAAQAELKAKRETLDLAELIPPDIADEDNIFATPLWQELVGHQGDAKSLRLSKFKEALGGAKESSLPWRRGASDVYAKPVDFDEVLRSYQKNGKYPKDAILLNSARSVLQILNVAEGERAELIAISSRGDGKFPLDYEKGFFMTMPHITHVLVAAKYLQLHAAAEAEEGQGDQSGKDVLAIFQLAESFKDEPLMISQLVRMSVLETGALAVWEGIFRNIWNADQLEFLKNRLWKIELRQSLTLAFRGERATFIKMIEPYTRSRDMRDFMRAVEFMGPDLYPYSNAYQWYPSGLVFDDLAYYSLVMQKCIEASQGTSPLKDITEVDRITQTAVSGQIPGARLATRLCLPPFIGTTKKFLETEARVRQAIIACELERYRITNGSYPESLFKVPDLPVDPIDGDSFRYRKLPDGGYRLWSIGSNATDDQGVPPKNWASADATGDWVWTMPGSRPPGLVALP